MSQVAIIIGSKSDDKIVQESGMLKIFEDMKISYEYSVISAHRHPEKLRRYCKKAISEGAEVFIGIAGMAAELPGVIQILHPVPVIGVPLTASDKFLSGLDALVSILRQPPGFPVIAVGINKTGLQNAAYCAIEILNLDNKLGLSADLKKHRGRPSQLYRKKWSPL